MVLKVQIYIRLAAGSKHFPRKQISKVHLGRPQISMMTLFTEKNVAKFC